MHDTAKRMFDNVAAQSNPYEPDLWHRQHERALTFLAGECDALRAENETLRSDLRQLQNAVAELTHATKLTCAGLLERLGKLELEKDLAVQRERPEPGATLERMQSYMNSQGAADDDAIVALAECCAFLANELDKVRR